MPEGKYSILVVNGPNLGYIGQRHPGTYGTQGMDAMHTILEKDRPGLSARIHLSRFQANGEGEIIDRLEQAWKDKVQGLVINPGAYTHTSLALGDCLAWINIPHVEVHLSNIWSREEIRRQNLTAAQSLGVIAGFGVMSYVLGLEALVWHLDKIQD
ncbi:type II 3-dehydroquinate dehydratase [Desulfonatronospira sp.]|uniref:type II 3-dehydroquinate dehydratase n=1 Tax=Desulfonatronospira sp. TaxID=1962951 RepID=UPI0025BDC31C|nr:type II 3-dehydroquinate dehydratase [Desulfonatronospira sp.]